ncbi:metal ABC transporter solute-binding protein, Zn/Mn family [Meiothermus hypogaeus]|uniref:Manganese transporter n=2 Tax=Meiothermus hypogaeus TaxID=884155 RepID=A0A511R5E1_9DEIN|nr:zinc ABC transporter substrate-binding protein [Meiothermus hypogaeus]RIH76181.1 Periplasmic zinc-binding protein TroA [Meiothermus hypogaeus]GEM84834.1 manganese transporter [Meiothermus hypogaeus NBRC 106114]
MTDKQRWLSVLSLLILTTCLFPQARAQQDKIAQLQPMRQIPLQIVATVNFVTDLVQQVGGNRVRVEGLMGTGVDPHLYKASAGDVRKLQQAHLIFYAGLHLEGKMVELLERLPRAIAVSDAIPRERLIRPPGGFGGQYTYDPHVWFDVTLWKLTVTRVRDALSQIDPAGAAYYRANAAAYGRRLEQLDAFIRQQIAQVPAQQRVMITAHDAFAYFGRRYGLEVRGLQGVSTVSEAGTRDVQQLADFIVQRRIRAVFVESSVPQRALEAVVAAVRARGWNVVIGGQLFSDAAGNPGTPEGTYVGMMEHNIRTIVSGLLGRQL